MEYKSYPSSHIYNLLEITDEFLQKYIEDCRAVAESNRAMRNEKLAAKKECIRFAIEAFGTNSKEVRYLEKTLVPFDHWVNPAEKLAQRVKEARAEEAKRVQEQNNAIKQIKLQEEAIQYLLDHGKKLGTDFALVDAISEADDLSADIEIARRIKELTESNGYTDFNGNNCGDADTPQCKGWDGVNNRCDCGNRRVCWSVTYYHSFKDPHVEGEAH